MILRNHMEYVIRFLIVCTMSSLIQSYPIETESTIYETNFTNHITTGQELSITDILEKLSKVSKDIKRLDEENRRMLLTKYYFPRLFDIPPSYVGQVDKRSRYEDGKEIESKENSVDKHVQFLNLPVINQPYNDYNILVAVAPANLSLTTLNRNVVVYILFPDEGSIDTPSISNIPRIIFVNERTDIHPVNKDVDPILIVDNKRTVTQLKSSDIVKFLRFKNKLKKRYNYEVAS